MKKTLSLVFMLAVVMNASAAGYGELEMPGWLTFMGIVIIVFGILEIVLFFKIWAMTDDVKAMKKHILGEGIIKSYAAVIPIIRKDLVLGNKEQVKTALINNFIDKLERKFYSFDGNYDSDHIFTQFTEENLNKSIELYVNNLRKQFDKIGEKLPENIAKMKTFKDYFDLFTEDDLKIYTGEEKKQ